MPKKYLKIAYNILPVIIITFAIFFSWHTFSKYADPPNILTDQNIHLNFHSLFYYSFKTIARFTYALFFSIIFGVIYACIAAKNKRIGALLIPILDLFQSIPVLGYISFTVTFFLSLSPNSSLGPEFASIFAIFTAQVWNIIFSAYQSFCSVPRELYEVAQISKLNKWQVFWKIEFPFAIPGLVWNAVLSMSASWFFVVAQEVISVGSERYVLEGIGAYIMLALKEENIRAIAEGAAAIGIMIFIYNEIIFKPIICWSERYRYEFNSNSSRAIFSIIVKIFAKSDLMENLKISFGFIYDIFVNIKLPPSISRRMYIFAYIAEIIFWGFLTYGLYKLQIQISKIISTSQDFTISEIIKVVLYGLLTFLRIMIMLSICSLIWIPVGIFIGLKPRLSSKILPLIQFFTAIPANLYYPFFAFLLASYKLNPDILLSVMVVIGSQWYILYNVISGTQNIPNELLEVSKIFNLSAKDRYTKILLPAISSSYLTGLITAAGASWNASIVAEYINWGTVKYKAHGLGSYITLATNQGNYAQIILGIAVMCILVLSINRILWTPLSSYISSRFRLE